MADTKDKSAMNEKVLDLIEDMSPKAANLILKTYYEMPYVVKDALDEYYRAKEDISDKNGIAAIKKSLKALQKACEANAEYMNLYDIAKNDANQEIAELYANGELTI